MELSAKLQLEKEGTTDVGQVDGEEGGCDYGRMLVGEQNLDYQEQQVKGLKNINR